MAHLSFPAYPGIHTLPGLSPAHISHHTPFLPCYTGRFATLPCTLKVLPSLVNLYCIFNQESADHFSERFT